MKTNRVEFRVTPLEKKAFEEAAEIAGVPLASWMRTRLRQASVKELENVDRTAPFLAARRG